MVDLVKIEGAIDQLVSGETQVDMRAGGVVLANVRQLEEQAKHMAIAGPFVPSLFRGNVGSCYAVYWLAQRFGLDPFMLANHTYVMVKKDRDGNASEKIAFESIVFHAILNASDKLEGSLTAEYVGEGDTLKCVVRGKLKGQAQILEHTTTTVGERKASLGKNQYNTLKGSPLWETKPRVQLWYDGRRDWARMYAPEILLGFYDTDELEEGGYARRSETAKDITPKPKIAERLSKKTGSDGFNIDNMTQEPAQSAQNGGAEAAPATALSSDAEQSLEQTPDPAVANGRPDSAGAVVPPEAHAAPAPPVELDPKEVAFEAGYTARVANRPMLALPEQYQGRENAGLAEAFRQGWRVADKERTKK